MAASKKVHVAVVDVNGAVFTNFRDHIYTVTRIHNLVCCIANLIRLEHIETISSTLLYLHSKIVYTSKPTSKSSSNMAQAPPPAKMGAPSPSSYAPVSATATTRKDNTFCFSTPWDACVFCNACFVVPERTHYVELYWGAYHGTITEPGCYCRSACAVELRRIPTNISTYDLENVKVLDSDGSPVIVSGIVTYEIVDARAAAIDVRDAHRFVRDQAAAVLKRVVSMYPYEGEGVTLRGGTEEVGEQMKEVLGGRVKVAGVRVEAFVINELSYAPEIAGAMLKRQQAHALIAARKAIVTGAKDIAKDAVEELGEGMSPEEKARLLGNLLVVLVGDKDVTPTVAV